MTSLTKFVKFLAKFVQILHYSSDLWPYSCHRKDHGIVPYIFEDEDSEFLKYSRIYEKSQK